jgi:glycosyltransferase involved in cell wall biosynthesis
MRIGIDVRLWNQTGVGRYIRNLVENLHRIDKRNSYILFSRKEDLKQIPKDYKSIAIDAPWHTFMEQLKFFQVLNKQNLDLVHFTYFSHPIFYNKPFVVTIHDLIIEKFNTGNASTLPSPFYTVKRLGYKIVLNHAIRNSKRIIVPTNFVKEDIIQNFRISQDKIFVIYEGFDRKIEGTGENEYGNYFLYVGNAYPHKNLEKMIEAFRIFSKRNENFKLILVGKNDYFYKRLKNKINENTVLFLHDVSDSKLYNLYKNAVSLVDPSLIEGFGLPVLEAISVRCPVIASDIPTFREIYKDLILYFNSNNIVDIANKMEEVVKLKNKFYEKKSDEIIVMLDKFNWEKTARKTLQVYASVFSA